MTLAGVFIGIGTLALMVLIVVAITGGFLLDAGPVYLSAHRVLPPLLISVLAYAAAAITGRQSLLTAARAAPAFLERHAASAAVVLAAAAAGIGIGYGTHAASGADASGYLNQATLIARGELVLPVPLATRVPWSESEWSFAPLGFRPGLRRGEIVPTYPPGLPLVMALATVVGEAGPFFVVPLLGALTVLCTFWLGSRVSGDSSPRTAGAVAAALMATSPVFLFQLVTPMSDVPAAALWTLALLLASVGRPLPAGAVTGLAVLMRPSLAPVTLAVLAALSIWSEVPAASRRAQITRVAVFGAALSLGIGALALIQWRLYGHPLASGHGTFAELFAAGNILPNVRDYARRVLTGETPMLVLVGASILTIALVKRQSPSMPVSKPLRLTLLAAALVLACYLPYGVFPDWSYLRFLLPALPLAFITTGALVVAASQRLPAVLRGPVVLAVLTAACATNITIATREGVFDAARYESRYRTAGRYLDAALPPHAVIVTSQESGSAMYYTHRPVLRWDLLNTDLDQAVATLNTLEQRPVLLVEDWEEPALRRRFPASSIARLDWPARARFGTTTVVRLFDPADRNAPRGFPPDRLP